MAYDLKLDGLALELDRSDLEVDLRSDHIPSCTLTTHSDGRNVALSVRVVGESQQKTRLSDTRVSDQQELRSAGPVR